MKYCLAAGAIWLSLTAGAAGLGLGVSPPLLKKQQKKNHHHARQARARQVKERTNLLLADLTAREFTSDSDWRSPPVAIGPASLEHASHYCSGEWGVERKKIIGDEVEHSFQACVAEVAADSSCGEHMYFGVTKQGERQCRCVMAGKTCRGTPSPEGSTFNVYRMSTSKPEARLLGSKKANKVPARAGENWPWSRGRGEKRADEAPAAMPEVQAEEPTVAPQEADATQPPAEQAEEAQGQKACRPAGSSRRFTSLPSDGWHDQGAQSSFAACAAAGAQQGFQNVVWNSGTSFFGDCYAFQDAMPELSEEECKAEYCWAFGPTCQAQTAATADPSSGLGPAQAQEEAKRAPVDLDQVQQEPEHAPKSWKMELQPDQPAQQAEPQEQAQPEPQEQAQAQPEPQEQAQAQPEPKEEADPDTFQEDLDQLEPQEKEALRPNREAQPEEAEGKQAQPEEAEGKQPQPEEAEGKQPQPEEAEGKQPQPEEAQPEPQPEAQAQPEATTTAAPQATVKEAFAARDLDANEKPPPSHDLFGAPGQGFCSGKPIFDGPTMGWEDCKRRCAIGNCNFWSYWHNTKSHWCKLTKVCDSRRQDGQHTISAYLREEVKGRIEQDKQQEMEEQIEREEAKKHKMATRGSHHAAEDDGEDELMPVQKSKKGRSKTTKSKSKSKKHGKVVEEPEPEEEEATGTDDREQVQEEAIMEEPVPLPKKTTKQKHEEAASAKQQAAEAVQACMPQGRARKFGTSPKSGWHDLGKVDSYVSCAEASASFGYRNQIWNSGSHAYGRCYGFADSVPETLSKECEANYCWLWGPACGVKTADSQGHFMRTIISDETLKETESKVKDAVEHEKKEKQEAERQLREAAQQEEAEIAKAQELVKQAVEHHRQAEIESKRRISAAKAAEEALLKEERQQVKQAVKSSLFGGTHDGVQDQELEERSKAVLEDLAREAAEGRTSTRPGAGQLLEDSHQHAVEEEEQVNTAAPAPAVPDNFEERPHASRSTDQEAERMYQGEFDSEVEDVLNPHTQPKESAHQKLLQEKLHQSALKEALQQEVVQETLNQEALDDAIHEQEQARDQVSPTFQQALRHRSEKSQALQKALKAEEAMEEELAD